MKRKKYAAMLVHFYITWMCVEFIDRTLGITMCEDGDFVQGNNVTLNVSLAHLNSYNGNCSCRLQAVNTPKNVTLVANIQSDCDSMSINISHWNYSTCLPNKLINPTIPVYLGDEVSIFLDVPKNTEQLDVVGLITFSSSQGLVAVLCEGAVYDIPPSITTPTTTTTTTPPTTTPTTTIRTTTPGPPVAETVIAAAAITFGGFVILMIPIALCIRYREKKKRRHDAEAANLRQVIPDIEREKIDPEMTKYSWFKTLTIRLRRLYYGEERRGRSRQSRGVKGRSLATRNGEGPTGTQTRKRFSRLFRKKSESTSSSSANRDHSVYEDDDRGLSESDDKRGDTEEVFPEVPAQHGGGIFMDVRRPSCETLEQTPGEEQTETSVVATVHGEQGGMIIQGECSVENVHGVQSTESVHDEQEEQIADALQGSPRSDGTKAEEDYVSSLFGDFVEEENITSPTTSSVMNEKDFKDPDIDLGSEDNETETKPGSGYENINITYYEEPKSLDSSRSSNVIQDIGDMGDDHYSSIDPVTENVQGDGYSQDVNVPSDEITTISDGHGSDLSGESAQLRTSKVIENGLSDISIHSEDNVSKISNGHPPENIDELYASVNKKKGKLVPMFRI